MARPGAEAQFSPQAPPPQQPPEWTWPPQGAQDGAEPACSLEGANTDSFLVNWVEPQEGQAVPFQSDERTSTSLSFPHFLQWNS